ncbi:esterase E4-like isoform X1 [Neodiprion lecontei]|uniref:Esterase E4-like isoform X1 n=1 Tax=Neodiprion lecontei TaxID=441921 RepID=A0A6J0C334_NEOLC|nr:esterase E4-like isoform X1 [Neodiprion lecontei]
MVFHSSVKCVLLLFLLMISICSINYAQTKDIAAPVVTIPQGTLQGTIRTTNHNRNISAFLGIPYAQPPIGNLRFANPVAADGWNGSRKANVDLSMCPQTSEDIVLGNEDCLWLNIYTPQFPESTNSALLPVIVYIYGGGFRAGNARSDRYGPDYLLDADIVLVLPSYRIGPLGFLSTGDEVASGNWGLKDQVLALEWVQKNIKYFGGDPDRVTFVGASSGGACVHLLTLSDATIGLFHKYITQSGSALATWAHTPRAACASRAFQLGEYVGCFNNTSDSLIDCLRTIDFVDILATQPQFFEWRTYPGLIWGPTDEPDIEGAVLTDSPTNLFAAGKIRDLPWISGVTRDEGTMFTGDFFDSEEMFQDFLENYDFALPRMMSLTYQPDKGSAYVNGIKSYYLNNDLTTNTSVVLANITHAIGDGMFRYPAYDALLQQNSMAKNPQYFYTFNYRGTFSNTYLHHNTTKELGVAHGDETFYIFAPEPQFARLNLNKTTTRRDLEIVDIMVQLWTSFATNGTPTTLASNGTIWKPFSAVERNYLQIGNGSEVSLKVQHSFFEERMKFWATLKETPKTLTVLSNGSNAITSKFYSLFVLMLSFSKIFL